MKIRITGPERIPTVEPGKIYDAKPGLPNDAGERVYFIHLAGEWLGIRANECEVLTEDPVYRWHVTHPDHDPAEVVGRKKYNAVIAAAKVWRVPWTSVARACTFENLGEVALE